MVTLVKPAPVIWNRPPQYFIGQNLQFLWVHFLSNICYLQFGIDFRNELAGIAVRAVIAVKNIWTEN